MSQFPIVRNLIRSALLALSVLGVAFDSTRVDASADPLGPEFNITSGFTLPFNGFATTDTDASGNFVVAWQAGLNSSAGSIYATRFDASGMALDVPGAPGVTRFLVNPWGTGGQERPVVSMASGGAFVIAWSGDSFDEGQWEEVYARVFNADGTEAINTFRVNTYFSLDQSLPDVSMADDGSFVVAWQSNGQDGDQQGIYAQAFNADGTRRGTEVAVSQSAAGFQVSPCIALLADGSYIVAWESEHIAANFFDIYARRFTADGTPLTDEFRVNVTTPVYQGAASCCALPGGGYALAWQSNSPIGVFFRVFDSANSALTGELRATPSSGVVGGLATIRSDASGNIVLAWQQASLAQQYWDIFARQYTPSGLGRSPAFQLNTSTLTRALSPALGVLPNGDFVATWHEDASSSSSIRARLFEDTTPPPGLNHAPVLNSGHSHELPTIDFLDENNEGVLVEELLVDSVTDDDPGAAVGIAVIGISESMQGRFEYSIDGGQSWLPLPAVSNNEAILLGGDSRVRFAPHPSDMGSAAFTFRAWDQTTGVPGETVDLSNSSSVGGVTAFSQEPDDATVTITNPGGQIGGD